MAGWLVGFGSNRWLADAWLVAEPAVGLDLLVGRRAVSARGGCLASSLVGGLRVWTLVGGLGSLVGRLDG